MRIAIAGLGPKGLFALERLLDHARDLPRAARIAVDIFEPHPAPGAGPVYDPEQPAFLRMNFAAEQLDMWWPGTRAVPNARAQTFTAWRAAHSGGDEEYPPRAQVGQYLTDGLESLLRNAPANVDITLHRARVEAVRPDGDGWSVQAAGAAGVYDEVLIAVGHQDASGEALAAGWAHAATLVPAVFPVTARLGRDRVAPGATVAVRGFALTFIDAALALAEGRGGTFEPLDHAYRLRYVPAGDEPRSIIPFSRSGQPLLAKPGRHFAERFPSLEGIAEEGRGRILDLVSPCSLERDLLPILADAARASLRAVAGDPSSRALGPAAAIERSLAVGAGLATPDRDWARGHAWRSLYPAIVAQLGGDGLEPGDWPAFLRLAAEMERLAFGPPALNAAKLLALVEAGLIDLGHLRGGRLASVGEQTAIRSDLGEQPVAAVIDAVLPGPGASGYGGLLGCLVACGFARVRPGRRGLDVTPDGSCRAPDGSLTHGLAAIGRPTEDAVIGNDTLSRGLHPHADLWARRVAERTRRLAATPDAGMRVPAPA